MRTTKKHYRQSIVDTLEKIKPTMGLQYHLDKVAKNRENGVVLSYASILSACNVEVM